MSDKATYSKFRWFVLLTLCVATITQAVALIAPAPFMGIIAKELGLSIGETTGAIMGSFTLLVALSCIVGGIFIDKIGLIRVFLVSLVLIIIGRVLVPVVGNNIQSLIILRIIEGCGAGPIAASVSSIAAIWFPVKERPIVAGIAGMATGLGVAIGFISAPAIFQVTGSWQMAMAWLSAFSFLSIVLTLVVAFGPKPAGDLPQSSDVLVSGAGDFAVALRQPVTWVCVLCVFALSWMFSAFNDLTPGYLAIEQPVGIGLGPMEAGKTMMIYQVAFMAGSMLSGFVTGKIFRGQAKLTVLLGFLVAAIFCVSIKYSAVYSNGGTLLLCLILAGFFMSFVNPQVMAFIARYYPEHITGKIGGLAMGIGIFGATIGVIAGASALHATGLYHMSINIVGTVAIIGFIIALGLNPPKAFCINDKKYWES